MSTAHGKRWPQLAPGTAETSASEGASCPPSLLPLLVPAALAPSEPCALASSPPLVTTEEGPPPLDPPAPDDAEPSPPSPVTWAFPPQPMASARRTVGRLTQRSTRSVHCCTLPVEGAGLGRRGDGGRVCSLSGYHLRRERRDARRVRRERRTLPPALPTRAGGTRRSFAERPATMTSPRQPVAQSAAFLEQSDGGRRQSTASLEQSNGGLRPSTAFLDESDGGRRQSTAFLDESNGGLRPSTASLVESDGGLPRAAPYVDAPRA